ncbi:MAG: hypothetical protein AB1798_21745, partial [Spirochaetota bacterium]
MDKLFLEVIVPLSGYVKEILVKGWRWAMLSIREYNLIVFFADFCEKMSMIERAADLKDTDFFKMEEAFLKIVYREEYPQIIVKIFEKILILHNKDFSENREKLEGIIKNFSCFFTSGCFSPSIYDLLLIYNMVRFRRYLE